MIHERLSKHVSISKARLIIVFVEYETEPVIIAYNQRMNQEIFLLELKSL